MSQPDDIAVLLYTREGIIFSDVCDIFSEDLRDRVLDYYKIYAKRHPLLRKGHYLIRRGPFGKGGADIKPEASGGSMSIGPSHETGDYYDVDPVYSEEEADCIQANEDAYKQFIHEIGDKIALEFDALPQEARINALARVWSLVSKDLDSAKAVGAFRAVENITTMVEAEDLNISDAADIGYEEIASWLEKAHKEAQRYKYFDPDAFGESGKKHILSGLDGRDLVSKDNRLKSLCKLMGSHRVGKEEMKPQRPGCLHPSEDFEDVGF